MNSLVLLFHLVTGYSLPWYDVARRSLPAAHHLLVPCLWPSQLPKLWAEINLFPYKLPCLRQFVIATENEQTESKQGDAQQFCIRQHYKLSLVLGREASDMFDKIIFILNQTLGSLPWTWTLQHQNTKAPVLLLCFIWLTYLAYLV
jgi:hypothetical protein